MFYNPKFEAPKPRFISIREVDPKWAAIYAKRTEGPFAPFASYEEALESPWTGPLRFWKDSIMYEGSHVAANHYKPLEGVQCEHGINWDTWYACNPNELMSTLRTKYTNIFGGEPHYSEEFGVWSIQVHYAGRGR